MLTQSSIKHALEAQAVNQEATRSVLIVNELGYEMKLVNYSSLYQLSEILSVTYDTVKHAKYVAVNHRLII